MNEHHGQSTTHSGDGTMAVKEYDSDSDDQNSGDSQKKAPLQLYPLQNSLSEPPLPRIAEDLMGEENVENYFRNLPPDEIQEIIEFQEAVKMESHSKEEVKQQIIDNPSTKFYILGVMSSPFFKELRQHPNVVTYINGHSEIMLSKSFDEYLASHNLGDLDWHAQYVEHMIAQGYKIVMIVPPGLLTYFNGSTDPDKELATIKEFHYLIQNVHRMSEDQLLIVSE